MENRVRLRRATAGPPLGAVLLVATALFVAPQQVRAFTLQVVDTDGQPVAGFRYLVEEDTTPVVEPGVRSLETATVT